MARFGQHMTPDDMYQSTRLAAAEAVNSGITTVHDRCHNARSRDHAEADLRALRGPACAVGGRVLKSGGRLEARTALDVLRRRTGWR